MERVQSRRGAVPAWGFVAGLLLAHATATAQTPAPQPAGVVAVAVAGAENPYERKSVDPLTQHDLRNFSAVSRPEALKLRQALIDEMRSLDIYAKVIAPGPMSLKRHRPDLQLTMHGAWFARSLTDMRSPAPGQIVKHHILAIDPPKWGANASARGGQRERGLATRFELRQISTGKVLSKWYSFSRMEVPEEGMPVLTETLIEDQYHKKLAALAAKAGSP